VPPLNRRGLSFAPGPSMTTPSDTFPLAPGVEQRSKRARHARSSAGSPPQAGGLLWFGGWLFTIALAKLVWWKAILGLVVWPYFLGEIFR